MDFERLRRNWENLGRADPMWAILTEPGKEGGRWDEAAFFATGAAFVRWLTEWFARERIALPVPDAHSGWGQALDFGCGIGRLTQACAPYFASVTGVDISQPMIDRARQQNRHGDRVHYVCNPRPDLSLFADARFDFVLSVIVLQHMQPAYALRYLAEFLRVLRPGGLLFFQMATDQRTPGVQVGEPAPPLEAPGEAHMEIHCVPAATIRDALSAAGGELLIEEPDAWAGPHWTSAHFAVRRVARG